jgi:hypothetical protein
MLVQYCVNFSHENSTTRVRLLNKEFNLLNLLFSENTATLKQITDFIADYISAPLEEKIAFVKKYFGSVKNIPTSNIALAKQFKLMVDKYTGHETGLQFEWSLAHDNNEIIIAIRPHDQKAILINHWDLREDARLLQNKAPLLIDLIDLSKILKLEIDWRNKPSTLDAKTYEFYIHKENTKPFFVSKELLAEISFEIKRLSETDFVYFDDKEYAKIQIEALKKELVVFLGLKNFRSK